MASPQDHISMALFCDFENVALGVRDANYDKFDIKRVLERLLLKGSIVVKKAYCDWERYKGFKAAMHEANFELIEIPHVRQSGKNSADIRLVVDALDLCYTKSHVNTFVIISGDSDFSPLVSKLRENAKYVIGVGVKQSTSDLLTANCDEFIFYDDLVRESARVDARRDNRNNQPATKRTPEEEQRRRAELDARRSKAVEMAVETYEALVTDRDEGGKIWASVLKEAIKRRNPGFNENYYGFRTFGNLLEEAKARGLLEFGRDEKSSSFVYRSSGNSAQAEAASAEAVEMATETHRLEAQQVAETAAAAPEAREAREPREPREAGQRGRRTARGRGRERERGERDRAEAAAIEAAPTATEHAAAVSTPAPAPVAISEAVMPTQAPQAETAAPEAGEPRRRSRGGRAAPGRQASARAKADAAPVSASAPAAEPTEVRAVPAPVAPVAQAEAPAQPVSAASEAAPTAKPKRAPAKKAAARPRAARKTSSTAEKA